MCVPHNFDFCDFMATKQLTEAGPGCARCPCPSTKALLDCGSGCSAPSGAGPTGGLLTVHLSASSDEASTPHGAEASGVELAFRWNRLACAYNLISGSLIKA